MERDDEVEPRIDETAPGSDTDGADGSAAQLASEDSLLDRGVADLLDEGYSPPDREPAVEVPTPEEERAGWSLDTLLAAEEPDVGVGDPPAPEPGTLAGSVRAGRLLGVEDPAGPSTVDDDIEATDVGVDGGAASAEEAAVHVIRDDDEERDSDAGDETT